MSCIDIEAAVTACHEDDLGAVFMRVHRARQLAVRCIDLTDAQELGPPCNRFAFPGFSRNEILEQEITSSIRIKGTQDNRVFFDGFPIGASKSPRHSSSVWASRSSENDNNAEEERAESGYNDRQRYQLTSMHPRLHLYYTIRSAKKRKMLIWDADRRR